VLPGYLPFLVLRISYSADRRYWQWLPEPKGRLARVDLLPGYLPTATNGSDERFPLATFNYLKILKRKVIRKKLYMRFVLPSSGLPADISL
jgi:hypothetical protein